MSEIRIGLTEALSRLSSKAEAYSQKVVTYAEKSCSSSNSSGMKDRIDKGDALEGIIDAPQPVYNMIARNIRLADKVMDKALDYIEKMKEQLETLLKNYPPFPPGSEERVQILKSIQTFRKQIDQLTIPPPQNTSEMRTLSAHPVDPLPDNQALIENNIKKLGSFGQQVKAGIEGLNIPELSESSEDIDLYTALKDLDSAAKDFIELKERLKKNASEVFTSLPTLQNLRSTGGEYNPEEISEKDAELKSIELKMTLSSEVRDGLTGYRTQLSEAHI